MLDTIIFLPVLCLIKKMSSPKNERSYLGICADVDNAQ